MAFGACAVFLAMPSSDLVRSRSHPLVSFSSSSESSPALPARRPQTMSAFLGVSFSFAARMQGVHSSVGFPRPPMFRPQRFSHSRRLTPPCNSWICFAPLPRPRFLFRGFPQQPAGPTFIRPSPLVVDAARRHLAFRVLIQLSIRCACSESYLIAFARSPLEFGLPRVFLFAS